jgi:hypothetical protein
MKKVYQDLPNWVFEMEEVSASVYEVIGNDKEGHHVSAKGIDIDELIEECKKNAHKICNGHGTTE